MASKKYKLIFISGIAAIMILYDTYCTGYPSYNYKETEINETILESEMETETKSIINQDIETLAMESEKTPEQLAKMACERVKSIDFTVRKYPINTEL